MQLLIFAVALYGPFLANADEYVKTPERIVFQTTLGDLEFALWPEVRGFFRSLSDAAKTALLSRKRTRAYYYRTSPLYLYHR